MRKILIDHAKCTGCYICVQSCSLVKTGTINPAASRIHVLDWEETGVNVPVVCQHCAEPVCIASCPEGAIRKDPKTGIVAIDAKLCDNCSVCRRVCPYSGPVYSAPEKRVVLCDHCGGEPTCVVVCPTGALSYRDVNGNEMTLRLQAMNEIRESLIKKEQTR